MDLSEKQAEGYLAILKTGKCSVTEAAARAGIKRTTCYDIINDLMNKKLVEQTYIGKRKAYTGADPHALIESQEEKLQDARKIVPFLNAFFDEDVNKPISCDEVRKAACKLKGNKACGNDMIINEFLKYCPDRMLECITKLFNVVLDTGLIPQEWCLGMIKPLYKGSGDINSPDNYRGITILSCLGKLFTAVLNNRLKFYVEATGIIGDEQAGFRRGFSTIDHVFVLNSILELYLRKKKRIYCAFVDYKKAFDLVDRSSLWLKLISCGINGKVLKVIYNMYSNAKSCVKLSPGKVSDYFLCNVGVRQGENLSPLLFAIYLNDFELSLSKGYKGLQSLSDDINVLLSDDDVEMFVRLYVLLYADDTIIMAESVQDLQAALDAAYEYCTQWYLTVNTNKTKIVVFSRGKIRNQPVVKFGDTLLDVKSEYVYLGITFNYNNTFKKAICKQVTQAKRAMYSMIVKCKKLCLPIDIQLKLFHQLIVPILLYGCEVWGYENIEQIEVLHRKFLKQLLHLNKSTTNCMVYGETGEYKISYYVENRMLNFWCRMMTGNHHKLSFIMYRLLKAMYITNGYEPKWLMYVKNLLERRGFANLWQADYTNCTMSNVWFKKTIKLRGSDMCKQDWCSDMFVHDNCSNYRIFKEDLKLESYLSLLDVKQSNVLVKFRCRNSNLPVCKKGFVSENQSIVCSLCDAVEIGDEFHYLFKCRKFNESRRLFIKRYYRQNSNILKMHELLTSTNKRVLKNLVKFIIVINEGCS